MSQVVDPHTQLLDDARQAAAVASRAQQRVLRDIGEQDATFIGSLEEVAEAGTPVVVHTAAGHRFHGVIRVLAADHLTLVGPHGTAWVRLTAITAVAGTTDAGVRPGGADRRRRPRTALADELRGLVEDAAAVEVLLDGGARLHGVPMAAGRDVLQLRTPHGDELLLPLDRAAVVVTSHT